MTFPTDYSSSDVPSDYVCDRCGVTGCKLWREYMTCANDTVLECVDCAGRSQGKDVSAANDDGKIPWVLDGIDMGATDTVGWMVPAVPTEEGDTFWGYTSVPQPGVDWWKRLPTRAPLRVFYDGSAHVVARSRYDALRVSCEHLGERPEDYDASVFALVPLDKTIRITTESPGEAPDTVVTKTAAEWAADGRGFLCSEDC